MSDHGKMDQTICMNLQEWEWIKIVTVYQCINVNQIQEESSKLS